MNQKYDKFVETISANGSWCTVEKTQERQDLHVFGIEDSNWSEPFD